MEFARRNDEVKPKVGMMQGVGWTSEKEGGGHWLVYAFLWQCKQPPATHTHKFKFWSRTIFRFSGLARAIGIQTTILAGKGGGPDGSQSE